jgi:Xaa-Pro aminopeptidase
VSVDLAPARLARCLEEMRRRGLDALILGREANARYVSGARRLSLAGTRPFGPGCVVVRETGSVHLLANTDDGVPDTVPRQNLFGLRWDPSRLTGSVAAIPGLLDARRIGVDGLTPLFAQLLTQALPAAELVDGEAAMRAMRAVKLPAEVEQIRRAIRVAESALSATIGELRPGVSERDLLGSFAQHMTEAGATIPACEGTFCVTPRDGSGAGDGRLRQIAGERRIEEGDLVALSSGVLVDGYEGSLARTWPCTTTGRASDGARRLYQRWRRVWEGVARECRPGRTGADLRAAHDASGEVLPPVPIVHGVGLGFEPPRIGRASGPELEPEFVVDAGMVLAVQTYVWAAGEGGYLGKEVVLVTDDGPELLTLHPHGPLAA